MAEQVAVLAGGCFWCTEAVFLDVVGVKSVESGYTGGTRRQPHLQAGLRRRHRPCRGDPDHLRPDAQLSYDDLLDIFFATHDPTQLNRQGNDVGTQYRSAIFPLDDEQERRARAAIDRANADQDGRVVTTIEPMGEWWPAETYHQDYWATAKASGTPTASPSSRPSCKSCARASRRGRKARRQRLSSTRDRGGR